MEKTNHHSQKLNQRAVLAIGLTSLLGWGSAYVAINIFRNYGWGLFIWLPFVLGAASTIIYGCHNITTRRKLFGISMWTLLLFCVGLLAFAWEGIICMIMAFPIGLLFTWTGHWVGYQILKTNVRKKSAIAILLAVSSPSFMAFESRSQGKDDLRCVTTSIEIDAPPEQVWKNVIAFPQLSAPTEFIFKTGIAYPIKATIKGRGVGAVRYCHFSTGSFVEPITVWNEPQLLKFSVSEQPEPMKELSFYDVRPNHLHGYWISKQGQFKLIPLANGRTLLEGTTWYVNKIKPGFYWTVWSDYIVHKIHQRVLAHIKTYTER